MHTANSSHAPKHASFRKCTSVRRHHVTADKRWTTGRVSIRSGPEGCLAAPARGSHQRQLLPRPRLRLQAALAIGFALARVRQAALGAQTTLVSCAPVPALLQLCMLRVRWWVACRPSSDLQAGAAFRDDLLRRPRKMTIDLLVQFRNLWIFAFKDSAHWPQPSDTLLLLLRCCSHPSSLAFVFHLPPVSTLQTNSINYTPHRFPRRPWSFFVPFAAHPVDQQTSLPYPALSGSFNLNASILCYHQDHSNSSEIFETLRGRSIYRSDSSHRV